MEIEKRIIEKSRELFFRYGLKSVTMDDIARELGMSKKTLYESFPTKKDIITAITQDFLLTRDHEHKHCKGHAHNAVEELISLMGNLNHIFENMDVRVIYDMQRYYPEAWDVFLNFKNDTILSDIKDNLERGIKEGYFRESINIEIIARMRLEQVQLAMDPRVFPSDKFDITEVHKQLLLQYVNGLCTQTGHLLVEEYLTQLKTKA